jgi:hypothetical protein
LAENGWKGTTLIQLPKGTTYAVASAYLAAIAVSAATNASEAVLTTATNTYAVGDIVEFASGWPRANLRVFRVKAASSTSVTLEGFDTTSTKIFPAGGGAGSLRKISTWTPIPFMKSFEVSGGDPKYQTEEFLDYPDEIQLPNGFSATSVTMTIADDPSLPHNAVLQAATDSQAVTAVRAVLPSGAPLFYNGFVGFNPNPAMGSGAMTVKCGLALQGRVVRYAS